MENASKALLIAGGILIAILILSVVVYVASTTSKLASAQDEKKLAEQTAEFNKGFEAYNKKVMYGTDVITVVNKAIDYNKKLNTNQENYFIDIVLTINTACNASERKVIQYASGKEEEMTTPIISQNSLQAGTYKLKTGTGTGTGINEDLINFFSQPVEDTVNTVTYRDRIEKTYNYSALTNFKVSIFTCTEVSYSGQTGRINSMTFVQK